MGFGSVMFLQGGLPYCEKAKDAPTVGRLAFKPPNGELRFCGGLRVVLRAANQNILIASGNHTQMYQPALPKETQ